MFVSDIKNTLNLADSLKVEDQLEAKVNPKIKFGIFTRSKFQSKNKNLQTLKNIRTSLKSMKKIVGEDLDKEL